MRLLFPLRGALARNPRRAAASSSSQNRLLKDLLETLSKAAGIAMGSVPLTGVIADRLYFQGEALR